MSLMFEFHDDGSAEQVAALFGDGVRLNEGLYVEDVRTGDVLASAGLLGRAGDGRVYLLRWRGRLLGLRARVVAGYDDVGPLSLWLVERLGTDVDASIRTGVQKGRLDPAEMRDALRVAAEACLVLEWHLKTMGPRPRVQDPLGGAQPLSLTNFGYPEVMDAEPWSTRTQPVFKRWASGLE
ncbi:hypothetical protein [Aquipuribacter nitratireducens]|uniref:Phage protein n=2 Tax=Aquipuribacter nitratireducens TaxID=650104 RepID=A0ABW0GQR3_9MICO